MTKTTQAQARAILSPLGITLKKTEDGEYRVSFRGWSETRAEATAAYTNDIDDAIGTGKHMAFWRDAEGAQLSPGDTRI